MGLLGNREGPHRDCGCKFKVRSVSKAGSFSPAMFSCPGTDLLYGESWI